MVGIFPKILKILRRWLERKTSTLQMAKKYLVKQLVEVATLSIEVSKGRDISRNPEEFETIG